MTMAKNKQPTIYLQFQVHWRLRDNENIRKESNGFYPINIVRPVHQDSPGGADRVQLACTRLSPSARPRGFCCALTSTTPTGSFALRLPPNVTTNHVIMKKYFYGGIRHYSYHIIPSLASLLQCFLSYVKPLAIRAVKNRSSQRKGCFLFQRVIT